MASGLKFLTIQWMLLKLPHLYFMHLRPDGIMVKTLGPAIKETMVLSDLG